MNSLWRGLRETARAELKQRDYQQKSLAERLATSGVEAGELVGGERPHLAWIPGVEIFPRRVYPQRHRGFFGEFARRGEGELGRIGLWPRQWATATMYANTAKGFHVHPPCIPEGIEAVEWFSRLFRETPETSSCAPTTGSSGT